MRLERNIDNRLSLTALALTFTFFLAFFASSAQAAGQTLDFTSVALDPRAVSLGGEIVSDAAGASAVLANPAGLALPGRPEVRSSGASQFAGQAQNYAVSYFQPLGPDKGLGFCVPLQSVDGIPQTQFDADGRPQVIGSLSDSKMAAVLAYGQSVLPQVSLGAALKYYSHQLAGKTGSCFAADLGLLYSPLAELSFGLTVRDLISSPFSWSDGQSERLAAKLAAGATYRFGLAGRPAKASAAVSYQRGRTFRAGLGLEWAAADNFTFRGGCDLSQGQFYPAAGLGVNFGNFSLDYSYQLMDQGAGSSQAVSLGWKFE